MPKPLLVGVFLNQQEVEGFEILETDQSYLIPLDELLRLLKLEKPVGTSESGTQSERIIKTPLGDVALQPNEIEQIEGVEYLRDRTLRDRFGIQVRFSASEYALYLEVPWQSGGDTSAGIVLTPEVRPPQTSLSNLSSNTSFGISGNTASLSNAAQLGGQLAGGTWQVQIDHSDLLKASGGLQRPQFPQYFYQNRLGAIRYRLGQQQIQIHPLLSSLEFTGAQMAVTNQEDEAFNTRTSDFSSRAPLVSRRSQPLEAFRGKAPPASIVQLRVDGLVIDQQLARLDGQYEFLEVPLNLGTERQIEILIFDRSNPRVPVETRLVRLNASDLLLPKGKSSHLMGLGLSGNLLDDVISTTSSATQTGQAIGFYQWRQGFSKDFTLEVGLQKTPDAFQTEAGFIWRLANPWVFELGTVINHRGDFGYQANLTGTLPQWRVQLSSDFIPSGFQLTRQEDSKNRFNHSLEVSHEVNRTLTLGAIARWKQDDTNTARYLLPTFNWRPRRNLSFRGRPDRDGTYFFDASVRPSQRTELTLASTTETATLDFRYDISEQYQINVGTDLDRALSPRYFAVATRSGRSPRDPSLSLGFSTRDGEFGIIAGASLELFPGILGTVRYQSQNPFVSGSSAGDQNLQLLISTDFTLNRGRLRPARGSLSSQNKGAITGRLVVQGASPKDSLEGALIIATLTPGKQRRAQRIEVSTRTDAAGNFALNLLPSGIYILTLTPENLPIQLSPLKSRAVVEVKAGSTTSVDFALQPEFGVAGRVVNQNNQPIASLLLELVDLEGKVIAIATTDEFGLYRMDRILPGQYMLRLAEQGRPNCLKSSPQRPIQIKEDFLFGQDLQIEVNP